jgi:hypothetical protein
MYGKKERSDYREQDRNKEMQNSEGTRNLNKFQAQTKPKAVL